MHSLGAPLADRLATLRRQRLFSKNHDLRADSFHSIPSEAIACLPGFFPVLLCWQLQLLTFILFVVEAEIVVCPRYPVPDIHRGLSPISISWYVPYLKFPAFAGVPEGRGLRWGDFRGVCPDPATPCENSRPQVPGPGRFSEPRNFSSLFFVPYFLIAAPN